MMSVFRVLLRKPALIAGAALCAGILAAAPAGPEKAALKPVPKSPVAKAAESIPAARPAAAQTATGTKQTTPTAAASTKAAEETKLFAEDHPVLILQGLRCQVHQGGEIRQDIAAQTGRYDESAKILDLNDLRISFKDQNTTLGQVHCGGARVWMAADEKTSTGMHDMMMQRNVVLRTSDNWLLQTPEMRYSAGGSLLTSNKGYLKQFPLAGRYLVGRGAGFEIKLLLEQKSFEYCKEYGKDPQVEYRKSDKPVLMP